jgi:predicted nucleotidyltransferase
MSTIFSVVDFEWPALYGSAVERLLEHAQWIVKIVKYGKVRFKQNDITEFFVAVKESVTNILRRLNNT